ncbi:MAG TPA: glycoside hydrolase family 18 protein [Jatrophihabitantaceae bacterium]
MRKAIRVALTASLVVTTLAAAVPARAASTQRWVMGYYVGYQRDLMPANEIDWDAMTHIVVGPVNPNSDGTLDTSFDINDTAGPKMAKDLAKRAKAHGVVPMLMIGGAGEHDQFRAAAQDHLATLIDNLVSTMRDFGFRGLDLDWEPINPSDQKYVKQLVDGLRDRLPNAVLTMPVMWVTKTFPHVPSFYGTIARKLDRISIMSYGMAGPWDGWKTWHSSALTDATAKMPSAVDLNVTSFRKAGVPKAKLGVGIGFYGTCWTGGATGPRQAIGNSTVSADDNAMSYVKIMANYYRSSAYHYDTKAQAPYLGFSSPHGPQHCTYVSYENARSIQAKAKWARAQGLGSLIVWTVNQGHELAQPNPDALLAKAKQAFGA